MEHRKTSKAVTVKGTALWRLESTGPRGGREILWAERLEGSDSPTGWELWAHTASDASGCVAPAGTFGHLGLGR